MSATISSCARYRYTLSRPAGGTGGGTLLFVMLNPSTADATENDPTIRRCISFASELGFSKLEVGNLFAIRASNSRVWRSAADPIGPENDHWLRPLAQRASQVIVAWGANAPLNRTIEVIGILSEAQQELYCLATTAAGAPGHPLYVRRFTPARRWTGNGKV